MLRCFSIVRRAHSRWGVHASERLISVTAAEPEDYLDVGMVHHKCSDATLLRKASGPPLHRPDASPDRYVLDVGHVFILH